ncbi:MAG: hypothetical protein U5R14_05665 [Gemmatimonadota bacterium]|nr:hypothetical protein [Gemmatimonadota bacterium]
MTRIFGMAVGVVYLGIAFGAYRNSSNGWEAGHADLGFWWAVIGVLLTIASLGALIGTWLHTRTPRP